MFCILWSFGWYSVPCEVHNFHKFFLLKLSSHCTVKKVRPYLFVKFIQIFVSEFQQKTKKLCLLVLAQIL